MLSSLGSGRGGRSSGTIQTVRAISRKISEVILGSDFVEIQSIISIGM
jgi:hypothetical protein